MTSLNRESKLPLYCQLADIIKEQIEAGLWVEHTQLPTERELCKKYKVSRATVRQAMQELELNGYIYKSHGKGTFVLPRKIKQDLLRFYSFTEEMKKLGKKPSSKVIDFTVVPSTAKVAGKLGIEPGGAVYKFTRLRLADDEPMMLETTYVPHDRFPDLTKTELEASPLYDILTKKYGAVLAMAEEKFVPVATRENEAELLNYLPHAPSMMIERITYWNQKVIEYTVGIARGDKFEYRVVLK